MHSRPSERPLKMAATVILAGSLGLLGACGSGDAVSPGQNQSAGSSSGSSSSGQAQSSQASEGEKLPDVVKVELTRTSGDTFSAAVTISSPYDTPEQYADGWRVLDENGETLGEHELGHDHAAEQPFTRMQSNLTIPAGVEKVTVEGRDQANGYGGKTVTVEVPKA